MGVRIRGTLEDTDPLHKVPFKRAISRVKKGPLYGVSRILPRSIRVSITSYGRGLGFRLSRSKFTVQG